MTERNLCVILASDADIDVDNIGMEDVVYVERNASIEEAIEAVNELTDQHQNVRVLWGDATYTVSRTVTLQQEESNDSAIYH